MARSSDTIGNVVSILVVALVGYLAVVFLSKTISASQSAATIKSAGGNPLGGGKTSSSGSLGEMLAGLFGGKINDSAALNQLFQQTDQQSTNNLLDALSNANIPDAGTYQNPFDAAGISFPIDYTNGGGGSGADTSGGYLDATDPGSLDPSVTTYF